MKGKSIFLALGLSLTMGLGALAALHEVREIQKTEATVDTYYFQNTHNWDNLYIHYWGGTSTAATSWPGTKLTNPVGQDSGHDMYALSAATIGDSVNFVLNNNDGKQTADLTMASFDTHNAVWISSTKDGSDHYLAGGYYDYTEPADPSAETTDFVILDEYKILGDNLANIHIYGYGQDAGIKGMSWPGTGAVESHPTDVLPTYQGSISTSYPNIVINGNSHQTVNITDLASNYSSKILRILNSTDGEGHYETEWVLASSIDRPSETGYYISGVSGNWGYADAVQMENTNEGGNVARYLGGLYLAANTEVRVRSFYTDRAPFNQWATVGNTETDNWVQEGDNLKIKVSGTYDFYAKYEGDPEVFKFYVAEHVTNYQIAMTAVLFEGKDKVSTDNLSSQTAYSSANFEPITPARAGYAIRGVFEDEDCLTAYEPKKFNDVGHLYIKYTRLGYYMTGDDTFSGGSGKGWNVDTATRLNTESLADPTNNAVEGSFTIPEGASAVNPVKVKPLEYNGAETNYWEAVTYTIPLIANYSEFMKGELDGDGNIQFIKAGTYYVYVNKSNQVYVNQGADAFYSKFISEVGGVCEGIENSTKTVSDLQAIWANQKAAYNSLSTAEKDAIVAAEFGTNHEETNDLNRMLNKYSRIVTKYGLEKFEDFIFGQLSLSNYVRPMVEVNNTTLIITLVSITVVAVGAVAVYMTIKRRKHE